MRKSVILMLSLLGLGLRASAQHEPEQGGQKSAIQTTTRAGPLTPAQKPSPDDKEKFRVRLGITQQQQQQIDDLYNDTRTRTEEVRKAMREKQQALREVYGKYEIDETATKTLRIDIVRLHRKFGEIHADNERKLRTILSREQFDKLRELMKEQWEQRAQRRANRPPGSPPEGRPGPR